MSKILKAILISVYSALFVQFFRNLQMNVHEEIIEIDYIFRTPGTMKKLQQELKKYRGNFTVLTIDFKRPLRLATDLKYILKWTNAFSHYSSSIFRNGQAAFIQQNCTHFNCYLTNDKSLLIDIRHFDAILFDVENTWDPFPLYRAPHQKFIFTASESASNYPVCDYMLDDYYNLTWTYKLNSDIRWTYITVFDKNGTVVGPKINMNWIYPMEPISDEIKIKLTDKKKAAAWFVSNCNSRSNREQITNAIVKALSKYNLKLDVFGWCGNLTCPRDRIDDCLNLLQTDYYFYFAFENSLSEDYVTEKLFFPLLHYTVPVVYGGANYSRFLPPGSYINAGELKADVVASLMHKAITNKTIYYDYFRWHNHYVYKEYPKIADICILCRLLNDPSQSVTVFRNFRKWWNPYFEMLCQEGLHGKKT